jgi:DedD protein
MAEWKSGRGLRRGGAVRTALGLAALGTGAALVGAFLVGPQLKTKAPKGDSRMASSRAGSPNAETSETDEETRAPETSAAPATRDPGAKSHSKPGAKRSGKPERQPKAEDAGREEPAPEDADGEDAGPAPTRGSTSEKRSEAASGSRRVAGADRPHRVSGNGKDSSDDEDAAPPSRSTRSRPRDDGDEPPHATALRSGKSRRSSEETASTPDTAGEGTLYRIRVGHYQSKAEADEVRARLAGSGIPASVVQQGKSFTIQAGSYRLKENADRVVDSLRQQQLKAEITTR